MQHDLAKWIAIVTVLLLIATAGYAQLKEDSIAGVWLFEEGKGEIAKDTSGNGNHAEFGRIWQWRAKVGGWQVWQRNTA